VILVDTSVWIDHFRRANPALIDRLDRGDVGCHPFVMGELAVGSLRHRDEILRLIAELPRARVVSHDEALALVERRHLAGSGLGWVDVHLAASARVEGWSLWTMDERLHRAMTSL
jgi:predicted nucleic acid-binding protein